MPIVYQDGVTKRWSSATNSDRNPAHHIGSHSHTQLLQNLVLEIAQLRRPHGVVDVDDEQPVVERCRSRVSGNDRANGLRPTRKNADLTGRRRTAERAHDAIETIADGPRFVGHVIVPLSMWSTTSGRARSGNTPAVVIKIWPAGR